MKTLNEITEVVNVTTLQDDSRTEIFADKELDSIIDISGSANYNFLSKKLYISATVTSNMKIENLTISPYLDQSFFEDSVEVKCNIASPTGKKLSTPVSHLYELLSFIPIIELELTATNSKGVRTKRKTKVMVQTGTDPVFDDFSQPNKGKQEEK